MAIKGSRKKKLTGKYVPDPYEFGGGWDTKGIGGVDTPENLR
jgi:hypothetical protein